MANRAWRCVLAVLALTGAALAHAELTHFDITTKRPYGSFRSGDYVYWEGKVRGELSPQEAIPGIDKAPRNARGRVEYSARIILIVPADPKRGNGTLLVDVPNRGRAYAHSLYNSPRGEFYQSGNLDQGTGFLQDQGFSLAEVYWELGQGADLPSFADADGKTRYVEGAGFAIFRDTAHFLAHGTADSQGNPNPLRGSVARMIATGKSQSGRFVKTFLLHGFNNVAGKRLFDGMHIFVSAVGVLPIMQTGAGPESSSNVIPSFENVELRGYHEEPLAIADLIARVQARGEAVPKIIFVTSTTDYHSLRASLGRTGPTGTADRALPAGVRVYDVAGASHVLVGSAPNCTSTPGQLDWTPVARALLLKLNDWVATGAEPPPSKLMPLETAAADAALRAPGYLADAVIQVPKRDADGNALGGVRLPDIEAPLGTHGGLNQPLNRACMLVGAYKPFARNKAQREAANDARLSIAERYRNRDEYVDRIRVASRRLMQEGFLLPEDAAVIIEVAASSRAFAAP